MNIIHPIEDKRGITWAILAMGNRFLIVWREPGKPYWFTNPDVFIDPDPAIKALKKRVAMLNAAYLQEGKEEASCDYPEVCSRADGARPV